MDTVDALVIGAGPNGLVAANLLADHGWRVLVLEAQPVYGGAVRTAELTEPGFHHDVFSAFYPFGAGSPVFASLGLEKYGLQWRHAPSALAHPTPDGRCVVLSTDIDVTARSLESYAKGDGDAWRRLYGTWEKLSPRFVEALMRPFPPVRPALAISRRLGPSGLLRFARFATLPVRRLAEETFEGEGGALLLAGNALHTDLTPDTALSGLYGWLLACLGQQVGFPVPEGGAGRLADALVRRLQAKGGEVRCATPVERVVIRDGRAVGVRTAAGDEIEAPRGLLADVAAPPLFFDLVGAQHLPPRIVDDLKRFQWDAATVKVDWALDGPVPWNADGARTAGTVHLADDVDQLTDVAAALSTRRVPERPFILVGQQSMVDPTRSPPGTDTVWAYAHVPRQPKAGPWRREDVERFADCLEHEVERRAPGFGKLIRARHVMGPDDLAANDANLVGGAIGGGTSQLHQQLVFRPIPGLARPETPIRNLYLASSSAHPGGGVHGACGANAARAALWHDRAARAARAKNTLLSRGGTHRPART